MNRAHVCFIPLLVFGLGASENEFDAQGRLARIEAGAGWLNLDAQIKIAAGGWGTTYTLGQNKSEFAEAGGKKNWLGRLGDGQKIDVEIVQSASETPEGLSIDIKAGALKSSDMDALVYWIDLPSEIFAKGSFEAEGKDAAKGELPAELPAQRILASGTLDSVRFNNPDKTLSLLVKFDTPVNATIQDGRQWGKHFSLLVEVHRGLLE